jgi:membrane-bound lytic murein transglycosylase D
MKMKKIAVLLGVILVSGVFVFSTTSPKKESIHVLYPKQMNFAGEAVPYYINDVQERLDREMITNLNYHTNTTLVLKRANKVFPVIEPILKQYGVPDDFKYLAVIESSLVNAVSPAGARGVYGNLCLKRQKKKEWKLTDQVDERYHLEKSTIAACKYLLEAKNKFGNWTLAAASYNGGMAGISKRLQEQEVADFYDLLLTEETSRYVFRILALKEIMQNPAKYGFDMPKEVLYQSIPVKKIEVDSTINNLATFAKSQGINYKVLKIHNPWLRDKKLINKTGKKYELEIPISGYSKP